MESSSTLVEEISKIHETQTSSNEKLAIKGAPLTFSLSFKKTAHNMEVGTDNTLGELRMHIAKVTEVEPGLQKLMYKGMLKDDSKTLGELGIQNGIKMMLVGTSISEVLSVAAPTPSPTESKKEEQAVSEPLSEKLPHKKIVEKGPPDGAEPGKRGRNESLPEAPLNNIYNNIGVKVRLTFKLYTQELWIQSSSNTQKTAIFIHQKFVIRTHQRTRRIPHHGSSNWVFRTEQILSLFCSLSIHKSNSQCNYVRLPWIDGIDCE